MQKLLKLLPIYLVLPRNLHPVYHKSNPILLQSLHPRFHLLSGGIILLWSHILISSTPPTRSTSFATSIHLSGKWETKFFSHITSWLSPTYSNKHQLFISHLKRHAAVITIHFQFGMLQVQKCNTNQNLRPVVN